MYPLTVIVPHLTMDGFDELSEVSEAGGFTEFELELVVEGFLETVFPRAALLALRRPHTQVCEEELVVAAHILAALV